MSFWSGVGNIATSILGSVASSAAKTLLGGDSGSRSRGGSAPTTAQYSSRSLGARPKLPDAPKAIQPGVTGISGTSSTQRGKSIANAAPSLQAVDPQNSLDRITRTFAKAEQMAKKGMNT